MEGVPLSMILFTLQLSPSNADILEKYDQEMSDARQYSHKLNVVILTDKPTDTAAKDKEKEEREKNEPVCFIKLD